MRHNFHIPVLIGTGLALLGGLTTRAAAAEISVTVSALPEPFHEIFIDGNSGHISGFATTIGPGSADTTFKVTVGQAYPVSEYVNGVPTQIGTVTFDGSGKATYTPAS